MATVTGFVYYCPDLRLYRYKISDLTKPKDEQETDLKFDEEDLEISIATYLAHNDDANAKFMASMSGLARVNPHKIVAFDVESDDITIVEPVEFWKKHDAEVDAQYAAAQSASPKP